MERTSNGWTFSLVPGISIPRSAHAFLQHCLPEPVLPRLGKEELGRQEGLSSPLTHPESSTRRKLWVCTRGRDSAADAPGLHTVGAGDLALLWMPLHSAQQPLSAALLSTGTNCRNSCRLGYLSTLCFGAVSDFTEKPQWQRAICIFHCPR